MRHLAVPGQGIPAIRWVLFCVLALNGLLIAFAIHIVVASLAVLTQEMENTIWIYRDLMTLGRFPSDIYDSPMRAILIFYLTATAAKGTAVSRNRFMAPSCQLFYGFSRSFPRCDQTRQRLGLMVHSFAVSRFKR